MIPRISKTKAKEFALHIFEEISQFCEENKQEYMLFLRDRTNKSENAKNELKKIKGGK